MTGKHFPYAPSTTCWTNLYHDFAVYEHREVAGLYQKGAGMHQLNWSD